MNKLRRRRETGFLQQSSFSNNMNDFRCNSLSTTDDAYQRAPYFELCILRAQNLCLFTEGSADLQPYVQIEQEDTEWETNLALKLDNRYEWGDILELDIDMTSSFLIKLFDRDEFGSDALLGGFSVSPQDLYSMIGEEISLNIVPGFEDNDFPDISQQIVKSTSSQPMLVVSIRYIDLDAAASYQVKVGKYRNVIDQGDFYTSYSLSVLRNDGATWEVMFRYSQIYRLREILIAQNPQVKSIPFPRKTHFDWLKVCCQRVSRFSMDTIHERQSTIEDFLNAVLEVSRHNPYLCALLRIPSN